ncbi:MAG: hypothetical protein IT204_17125 [Fimbriimonadaceae bacterium]|nr:hypothetical protein [Fimbriimonadaceae bacterium]
MGRQPPPGAVRRAQWIGLAAVLPLLLAGGWAVRQEVTAARQRAAAAPTTRRPEGARGRPSQGLQLAADPALSGVLRPLIPGFSEICFASLQVGFHPLHEDLPRLPFDRRQSLVAAWLTTDPAWRTSFRAAAARQGLPADLQPRATVIGSTRLVWLARREQAAVLRRLLASRLWRGRSWALLAALAQRGWGPLGGRPEWGRPRLLLAPAGHGWTADSAPALWSAEQPAGPAGAPHRLWQTIQPLATARPGETRKALRALRAEPADGDLYVGAEAEAWQALRETASGPALGVAYPQPTVASELYLVTVGGGFPSVSAAATAEALGNYLRTPAAQRRLLQTSGLRPVLPALQPALTAAWQPHVAAGLRLAPATVRPPALAEH